MENTTAALGPGSPQPPAMPGPTQLPPQMFTTAASLLDLTDKKLIVILRDGRKIIGVLRSWDQFGNLVLQDSIERIFVSTEKAQLYTDVPQGVFLVRGENTMMIGEIDLDRDDVVPEPWLKGDMATVQMLKKDETARQKARERRDVKELKRFGFEGERSGEAVL